MTRGSNVPDPTDEINSGNMLDKLQEIHNEIIMKEERLRLLKSLQSKGLTTADIYHFNKKQASLRIVDKFIDKPTSRVTMSAKIRDAYKSLEQSWRVRQNIKKQCKDLMGGRNFKLQRLNRRYRQEAKSNRIHSARITKNTNKEKHLARNQLGQQMDSGNIKGKKRRKGTF